MFERFRNLINYFYGIIFFLEDKNVVSRRVDIIEITKFGKNGLVVEFARCICRNLAMRSLV